MWGKLKGPAGLQLALRRLRSRYRHVDALGGHPEPVVVLLTEGAHLRELTPHRGQFNPRRGQFNPRRGKCISLHDSGNC